MQNLFQMQMFTFATGWDQVQISICIYANFTYVQIWSCERKLKFTYMSIF